MVLALEKGLGEEAAGHCAGLGRKGRGWEEVAQEDAELAVLPDFPELVKHSLFFFLRD